MNETYNKTSQANGHIKHYFLTFNQVIFNDYNAICFEFAKLL